MERTLLTGSPFGRKQMFLPPGQSSRPVCSCYLLPWWCRWCTGTCALSPPSTPAVLPLCKQLLTIRRFQPPVLECLSLKYLVADHAKYQLFITTSFCVNSVLNFQYGFNLFFLILYVKWFQFSLGHFSLITVIAALFWNVLGLFLFVFSVSFKCLVA